MEGMIASLLKDFEVGKLTRRELIQALTMLAAAPAAMAAGRPAADSAPWKTTWLDHISFSVADYKKSVEFYTSLMGWEVQNDNGKTQATLNINNIGGIIIRNRRAGLNPPPPQPGRAPVTAVVDHISWGVTPWDTSAVEAELKRRGLNPRPDMVGDNFKSFHVTDPDGWDLQISNKNSNARG